MDLEEKLLGGFRDRKLMELYITLSHSDLKGNYEDTYTIELMFALMCIDLAANTKLGLELEPKDMSLLARNVVRCCDDGELSDYSFFNWSMALLTYMKENNLNANKINKMSTINLLNEVSEYLNKGE